MMSCNELINSSPRSPVHITPHPVVRLVALQMLSVPPPKGSTLSCEPRFAGSRSEDQNGWDHEMKEDMEAEIQLAWTSEGMWVVGTGEGGRGRRRGATT